MLNTDRKTDTLFLKFVEYFFYIFVFIFPFVSYKTFLYGGSSTRAVNLIILAIILGIVFSFYLLKKNSVFYLPKSLIFASIAVYFISLSVSGILGIDPHTSFWSVLTRTTGIWYLLNLGFIMYMMWLFFSSDRKKQDNFIFLLVISSAVFSFLSFLSPEGIGLIFKNYQTDGFLFGNSTFAGMYLFGSFLLAVYYLISAENKKWWMYILPVILLINPNFINSNVWSGNFSQGLIGEAKASTFAILFSLIIGFVIWLISRIKEKKNKTILAYSAFSLSLVVMIISVFSLLSHDGYLRGLYLNEGTAIRPLVWEMSEKVIYQRPYFGWGTDNFEKVFEKNYDNRILQEEYGNEAWLDRAHNVFIDQIIDNGYIGFVFYILIYIVVMLSSIYVFLNSIEKKDKILSSILISYFLLHIVELQTAFDTTISYFMLAVMVVLSVVLFDRTRSQITGVSNELKITSWVKNILAILILGFSLWSFFAGWLPFVRAQVANGYIRMVGSAEKRIEAYPTLFASPVDEHSFLWRTFTDFKKGIGANPKILEDSKKIESLKKEIKFLEDEYRKYVQENPNNFRARLNFADVLIYQRLFGVDKLNEAQSILDEAIKLVPQAPQSYWMKSVAYLYMRKFDLARDYAKKGLELNPKAKQSQDVARYIEESIKSFPEIDLYFFKQI